MVIISFMADETPEVLDGQRQEIKCILPLSVFVLDVKQPSILDAFSKPKPSSNTAAKKVPSFDSSDSEGEAKAPVTKAKPVLKRKQTNSEDSDSSSDNLMSRLKAKTTAGGKVSY